MKKILLGLCSAAAILSQASATAYVCPSSYKTIMTGNSVQQVIAACGKPESISNKASIQKKPITLKQWVYIVGNPSTANEYAPKMLITFNENKVSEINVANQNTAANFPCYRDGRIHIGTSASEVQIQCGIPSYTNSIQKSFNQPVKETVLIYNFGSYRPKMIFTFENGKLTSIETGQLAK